MHALHARPRPPRVAATFALMTALALTGCSSGRGDAPAEPEATNRLVIQGSDTMLFLARRWGDAFAEANPGVDVTVLGGGSGVGIAALLNDAADLANASRPMREREKVLMMQGRSKTAREFPVALDALAVFVHPDNPVQALTIDQIHRIYTGEIRNWKEVGGSDLAIQVFNRDEASGTYVYFQEHVLEGEPYWDGCEVIPETARIIEAVKNARGGVGYGGIAYVTRGVKGLAVARENVSEAVMPTLEHAVGGLYPLARILYVYSAGEPAPLAKQYLDFVRSEAGEAIIGEIGYYPLPDELPAPPVPAPSAPVAEEAPPAEGAALPAGTTGAAPTPPTEASTASAAAGLAAPR